MVKTRRSLPEEGVKDKTNKVLLSTVGADARTAYFGIFAKPSWEWRKNRRLRANSVAIASLSARSNVSEEKREGTTDYTRQMQQHSSQRVRRQCASFLICH